MNNFKLNLENINNVLLVIIMIMLIVVIYNKTLETFFQQPACSNTTLHANPNVMLCSGSNKGEVVQEGGVWYKCGDRSGIGFECE